MIKRVSDFAFALVVTGVVTTAPAHAYLDGGTISLVLQAATGAVAGALLFGKAYIMKVRGFFSRRRDDAQG